VNVVSSLEVVDALKLLTGHEDLIEPVLTVVDVWDGTWRRLNLGDLRERSDCPACRQGRRDWLQGERSSRSTSLCGRNAVQITPPERTTLSLEQLASRLEGTGEISRNPYLLRLSLAEPACQITVFTDGRAIIKGTEDVTLARSLYARYIGN
jgi:adenylyltransferase/sulfurtransferase